MGPCGRAGRFAGAIAAAAVMALTAGAAGQEPGVVSDIRAELRALRAEVAELRGELAEETGDDEAWLDERRSEEVRALVEEVMADARTRGGFGGGNLTAGYDGGFYISSEDGAYLLKLGGHLQVRHIANFRDNAPGDGDDVQTGFQVRRAKLTGEGHIADPRIQYAFSLAGDRDFATAFFEDYYLQYAFAEDWSVRGGRWKQPFARENIVSSSRLLAVERSSVLETFNVDRSEGVMVSYTPDAFHAHASINNGVDGQFTDFDSDANVSDFAVTGRGELLLAGEWDQFRDFNAWSGQPLGVLLGGGVHYQLGETGTPDPNNHFLLWTADLSGETNGLGLFLAGYGNHENNEAGGNFSDFGIEAKAGYMIVPDTLEPFVRYEYIMPDGDRAAGGDVSIVTAGFNWYQKGHSAKFTLDAVYALDPLVGIVNRSQSLGLDDDAPGEDGQLSIRAQYQLAF